MENVKNRDLRYQFHVFSVKSAKSIMLLRNRKVEVSNCRWSVDNFAFVTNTDINIPVPLHVSQSENSSSQSSRLSTPSCHWWLFVFILMKNYRAFSFRNQISVFCGWLMSTGCWSKVTLGMDWVGWAGLGDPGALGKKYREEREIEVAPVHVSEADSWEISG